MRTIYKKQLFKSYTYLRKLTVNCEEFLTTLEGGDLWIDGFNAIASTSPDLFSHYSDIFFAILENSSGLGYINSFKSVYDTFDDIFANISNIELSTLYHFLSVGISAIYALGGLPKLSDTPYSIINDSVVSLLSKNYRNIRFRAFNDGVTLDLSKSVDKDFFRPEFGVVSLGEPFVVFNTFPLLQFYNFAHEAGHIVFFSDAYIKFLGKSDTNICLLLNSEESLISLDLIMLFEISSISQELYLIKLFETVETGDYQSNLKTIFKASSSNKNILKYQKALKAMAQKNLNIENPLSSILSEKVNIPNDIYNWFGLKAVNKHIVGAKVISNRIHHDLFQELSSFIPLDTKKIMNVLEAFYQNWSSNSMLFNLEFEEPSKQKRITAKAIYRIKKTILSEVDEILSREFLDSKTVNQYLLWVMSASYAISELQKAKTNSRKVMTIENKVFKELLGLKNLQYTNSAKC